MIDKYVKMAYIIELGEVSKDLKRLPTHIRRKLYSWMKSVDEIGLSETRKQKGFHDEPLRGNRVGQRSIRLSKSYRAIYRTNKSTNVITIVVLEVNKHEY